jgi:hypothetical protein
MSQNDLLEQIEEERTNARAVCDAKGVDSPECAAAFDALEEVQAAASHKPVAKTNFEKYCGDNPDAVECRIYED